MDPKSDGTRAKKISLKLFKNLIIAKCPDL